MYIYKWVCEIIDSYHTRVWWDYTWCTLPDVGRNKLVFLFPISIYVSVWKSVDNAGHYDIDVLVKISPIILHMGLAKRVFLVVLLLLLLCRISQQRMRRAILATYEKKSLWSNKTNWPLQGKKCAYIHTVSQTQILENLLNYQAPHFLTSSLSQGPNHLGCILILISTLAGLFNAILGKFYQVIILLYNIDDYKFYTYSYICIYGYV